VAIGAFALASDIVGNSNVAVGYNALSSYTSGGSTAIGYSALSNDTTGERNSAIGFQTLLSNSTGDQNTAVGFDALLSNTFQTGNTAVGSEALIANTGGLNTAVGRQALHSNTVGTFNIALGDGAGFNLTTGDGNIDIGNPGVAGESFTIRIGSAQIATFIAGISFTAVTGAGVVVDGSGQLGVATSSQRFKEEVKPMDTASEPVLALKPVTFRYKKEVDPTGTSQFGLVAEDVEKVNPDLVVRDKDGKPYTVRYEAVNAMLLNEFLKEHKKVEELQKSFQGRLAEQQRQIEALTSGLQKLSAQVELSRGVPQMAAHVAQGRVEESR
jgi:hypothetical protein